MKKMLMNMLQKYKQKAIKRKNEHDLPPRPLEKEEVKIIIKGLTIDDLDQVKFKIFQEETLDQLLLRLLSEEVRRGTFPSSYEKARGLAEYIRGNWQSQYLTRDNALSLLKEMKGGAASPELVDLLKEGLYEEEIIEILKETVLINKKEFNIITDLIDECPQIKDLLTSWAEREFAEDWTLEDTYQGISIKTGDNITTGHLSPSKRANTRTDHPLHAQYIMEGREDEEDFLERLEKLRKKCNNIIFIAGKALGEGSSRKSATYTMLQILGKPVPGEPEKKQGGIVIAKSMAPIFKNSLVASGILPVITDTDPIKEGDQLKLDIEKEKIIINDNKEIKMKLPIEYKLKKVAAGGMTYFDAGNELQKWAVNFCDNNNIEYNATPAPGEVEINKNEDKPPQTLAQKIVGQNRLDGKDTILPGETAEVKIRGVYSQDTTGPMTIDEYQSMAGENFGSEFVVQSLCHTGECPSSEDRDRHNFMDQFVTERGGVCLEPGEGIIHTLGNRFVLPTDVIVGGDSHTRTPRGVSFPAASDIVAGAMKYGKQDLTMDESVKVIFEGTPHPGITARDLVSTLVVFAEKTVGNDIYNGRIIEMEGLEFLDGDKRYILTNAVAERSASAGTIPPDEKTIETIKSNLEYLKSRADADSSPSVKNTISSLEKYLDDPVLPRADKDAEYAAVIKIPLAEIKEPLVAKPHHPDNVAPLSEVGGIELDEIFIGSCVGGDLESIRAAAKIVSGKKIPHNVNFVVCPASRDIYQKLAEDGSLTKLTGAGATITMPGCGLCMGNKRRIGSGATALTTTTRNYQSRIGPADSETYLGSSRIAACAAVLGKFPSVDEYFAECSF
ncbi:MAG: bifunctional aconitate hydratase 2/2-methylisocitrate dehydratase [Halanaerobiaceae bacterium]